MTYSIKQKITDTLEQNYMPYAMSVIVSRAIPEIDGFKPSHRKLLYTMYKMKLINGPRTKSANVVGQTMKLNPHGDQAIYATMVRLTRGHDALILPYVDSKGNFGKSTSKDMKYAASRYTEVKLEKICSEIFRDIDKNTVPFMDNYDGTLKEPTLLPTSFPNILVNANKGIAVGMASSICSFNLKEVCEGTIEYLKDPEVDLMQHIKAPDFSTGGYLIYDEKIMQKVYDTGTGSFKLRGKYKYNPKDNCIEIVQIPYTTTVEQIIDKVVELAKAGKMKEVSDIRDETDLSGLKITLDLKRNADVETLMMKMYKMTPLEDAFACNFNILIGNKPKVMGLKEILHNWVAFRTTCIKNQTAYDMEKITDKLHLLKGLEKVLLDIDRVIEIIRNTEEEKMVMPNLMDAFGLDETQAEFVAEIKLRNINKEYILKRTKEIGDFEKELKRLTGILASDGKVKKIIIKQLEDIMKHYGEPRRTEIIHNQDVEEYKHEDAVEDYKLKVFFTDHNYFKKISLVSLRASNTQKLKDDDAICQEIEASNTDEVLFFTNKQNVYKMKLHEIQDHKASSLGNYLPNILDMEEGELVLHTVVTKDYEGYMYFAYDNGKVSKIPLSSYMTKTKRKKLVKAYSDFAPIIRILFHTGDMDLMLFRHCGDEVRGILANTELVPEKTTKSTRGIQVVRMKKGSTVLEVKTVEELSFDDAESYRVTRIPMSGTLLDTVDLLKYNALL